MVAALNSPLQKFLREVSLWYGSIALEQRELAQQILLESLFMRFTGKHLTLQSVAGQKYAAPRPEEQSWRRSLTTVLDRYTYSPYPTNLALTPGLLAFLPERLLSIRAQFNTQEIAPRETCRKQTGSFYTPPEMVEDVVRRALEYWLQPQAVGSPPQPANSGGSETAEDPLREQCAFQSSPELGDLGSQNPQTQLNSTAQTQVKQIAQVKICDLACGAGAFLLGVLEQLTTRLAQLDPENLLWKQCQLERVQHIENKAHRKRAIATLHQVFACSPNFARRFYLLQNNLYGVDVQGVATQTTRFRCLLTLLTETAAPLPQLNLATADSLLTHPVNSFDVKAFDLLLTNPPHVDSEEMMRTAPDLRSRYSAAFTTAKGNWDLSVVFVERGLDLLKPDGVLAYVVPNKLVGAAYARPMRDRLLNHRVLEIQDYSAVKLFGGAGAYPTVLFLQNALPGSSVGMTRMGSMTQVRQSHQVPAPLFYRDTCWDRYFGSGLELGILEKCDRHPPLHACFPDITGAATVSEAYALKPLIREFDASHRPHKKLINTGTIDPYCTRWSRHPTRYLNALYQAPILLDEDLLAFSAARFRQAAATKLAIAGMGRRLECFYDEGNYLAGKSTTLILGTPDDLKVLLAILNSRLISWWFRTFYRSLSLAGGYLRIGKPEIKTIPLAEVSSKQRRSLLHLVEQILTLKTNDPTAEIGHLDEAIDDWVFELYGLSEGERAIVKQTPEV